MILPRKLQIFVVGTAIVLSVIFLALPGVAIERLRQLVKKILDGRRKNDY